VLFRDAGYDLETDNPTALAVKGRLLKDQAFAKTGPGKWEVLAQAAAAYAAADTIAPQPWLLINVAALTAMQGKQAEAEALADQLLERIAPGQPQAETPYWLGATRAEALLIKGRVGEADAALTEARAHDPDGYEDHASTLKQFGRLIAAAKGNAAWLDKHRPPISLHYAGHLGVAADQSDDLRLQVDAFLAAEKIGFGYGALAAGADIIIAESLIARRCELHVILPAALEDFVALSVAPYGKDWMKRFAACKEAAASVHIAASTGRDQYEPLATALAAELAMGAAKLNAQRLESKAHQLLVIDDGSGPYGDGLATARDGAIWAKSGEAQTIITAPRSANVAPSSMRQEGRPDRRLAALLRLDFEGLETLDDGAYARAVDGGVAPFLTRLAKLEGGPAQRQVQGNAQIMVFADPAAAALYARRMQRLDPPRDWPLRLSAHYGLVMMSGAIVIGPALSALEDIAMAGVSGVLTCSENFATALQLRTQTAPRMAAQHVGDVFLRSSGAETQIFTLSL
jgi:hypothetical protein